METIEVFTGNRAEFGLLSPLIDKLSNIYKINLIVSGAHLLEKWNSLNEIQNSIKNFQDSKNINLIELKPKTDNFQLLLSDINRQYLDYKRIHPENVKYCLLLGDRIETISYAMSAMYLENILIHCCGGDISTFSGFDHNIRHAITKISHLHLVYNENSFNIVKQLGEEAWRICNTGIPSLDIINSYSLISKEKLKNHFNLKNDNVILSTYHPVQYISAKKNLELFKTMITGLKNSGQKVILTYPNNDPGYELILKEIEDQISSYENFIVISNLGIHMYLSVLQNINTILIGNSSSIITESPFFCIPSLLLGNRQQGRYKGKNVTELLTFNHSQISSFIKDTFENYSSLKASYLNQKHIYGDGTSATKSLNFIESIFKNKSREQILQKSFNII